MLVYFACNRFTLRVIVILKIFSHCQISLFPPLCMVDVHQRFWSIYKFSEISSLSFRSSRPEMFCKEGVHGNFAKFTGKHLCQRPGPATLLKKRLAQMFAREFCEISKNNFSCRTPLVADSVPLLLGFLKSTCLLLVIFLKFIFNQKEKRGFIRAKTFDFSCQKYSIFLFKEKRFSLKIV